MGRKITGIVFLLLCMCLIKGTMSSAVTQVAAGSCGEHATWTLDDENVLTIRGKGAITNRSWEDSWEWHSLSTQGSAYRDRYYGTKRDNSYYVKVVIEDGITAIGEAVFANEHIRQMSISSSVTRIGKDAFEHASIEKIEIPDSVLEIDSGAFYECEQLKQVHLSGNLSQISGALFFGCTSLESITIPDSVTEVGGNAFAKMTGLREITFGKNLSVIRGNVFDKSLSLRKIVNRSGVRFSLSETGAVTKRVTWYQDGAKTADISPGKTIVGKGEKYKLTYVRNGETVKGKLPEYFRYGEKVEFPSAVTKKGYLFMGWSICEKGRDFWWNLRCDDRGVICHDGFLMLGMRRVSCYKVRANFIKVKIKKKSKKTVVQVDYRYMPKNSSDSDITIRYADNPKMKKFKYDYGCMDARVKKNKKVNFIMPKSFRKRKCYMQFLLIEQYDSIFKELYGEEGWEAIEVCKWWFWSKSVVCKGK